MVSLADIRGGFLDYFRARGHEIVASSPLVPADDPSLLFTNAGMVQFKDVFLGLDKRPYTRAASSQACIRAGGKHNDLDNVGYTARHHTFFEMLGNFSFGDYFKRQAIMYAWDFLTKELSIPERRLWVTVFNEDKEAEDIWLNQLGVSEQRFSRCGEDDNFWQMADTGPCGPCSEIFYDHGGQFAGAPPGVTGEEGDRYVEIWNLVFTQYDRSANGDLQAIPSPSVDTGMGLERITAVLQNVHNNYDIDVFKSLIESIRGLIPGGVAVTPEPLRVIADHMRSCAFLIAEGIMPGNEGRAYVLRRIIRRAARHGNKLGIIGPFLYKLVEPLAELMGAAYPVLSASGGHVSAVLLREEQRFSATLEQGLSHLTAVMDNMSGAVIPGDAVFKLYDTYGFPADLTADIAREHGLQVDEAGFEEAMRRQRSRGRSGGKFSPKQSRLPGIDLETEFSGYDLPDGSRQATVIALYREGGSVDVLSAGDKGAVILDTTPFYAESGGQIGDSGSLSAPDLVFDVEDTRKQGKAYVHLGSMRAGRLETGATVDCSIDRERRLRITRNHSATHLLHAALRKILGEQVVQRGSMVGDEKLRFDFSHDGPVKPEQLAQVEALVNHQVMANQPTQVRLMELDQARQSGAISLFGEKYDDWVRVLKIAGDFSMELCGGTHVAYAGDIGLLKIVSESGVAEGVRRVEAVTGEAALNSISESERQLSDLAKLLKTERGSLVSSLRRTIDKLHGLETALADLQKQQVTTVIGSIVAEAETINGVKLGIHTLRGVDTGSLRTMVDHLKDKLGTAALVLASVEGDKIILVAGVTKDLTGMIKATDMADFVARQIGGKGGGRDDMAQAGGNDPAALEAALAGVPAWVREHTS